MPIIQERIWLSSEGFSDIMIGMKLPDQNGNQKLTLSAFVRAYSKIKDYKGFGIIIL